MNVADEYGHTLGTLVISTALSTVKWILIVAGLAATLFCCLFPYNAMSVYRSLGNYEKALEYCDAMLDNTADKQGGEYSALLVNAITMSSTVVSDLTYNIPYAETDRDKLISYAKKLGTYTQSYKSLPEAVRAARSKAVDDYNLSASGRSIHPQVYNFDAYVCAKSVYADSLLGVTNAGMFAVTDFCLFLEDMDISGMITAAAKVNAYIDFELYRAAYSPLAPGSIIKASNAMYGFNSEKDFAEAAENIGYAFELAVLAFTENAIDMLYAVNTLAVLADNIGYAAEVYQRCKNENFSDDTLLAVSGAKTVKIGENEFTLSAYYYTLLYLYTNFVI